MAVTNFRPQPASPMVEPTTDPATNKQVLTATNAWTIWFRDLLDEFNKVAVQATNEPVTVLADSTSIAATTIVTPQSDGLYAFEYYIDIDTTEAASTITPAIDWVDKGTTMSKTFGTVNGDVITNHGSERYMFRVDAGSPIRYSTTYVGATMAYSLYGSLTAVAPV